MNRLPSIPKGYLVSPAQLNDLKAI